MSIRRITVAFVGPDGVIHGTATGSVDRRQDLVRAARDELEKFKITARRDGDPIGVAEFEMSIQDAPAVAAWRPSH